MGIFYLKDVRDEFLDVLLQDFLEHGEESLFKGGNSSSIGLADDPNGQRPSFEKVVVEVRFAWVASYQRQFRCQTGQRLCQIRHHGFLKMHDTYTSLKT